MSVPALIHETIPEETVADVFDMIHIPPETESDKVISLPVQTSVAPEIEPASGSGFIVIILLTAAVPQLFEKE